MRNGFLGSLVALLTGTSLALAQPTPSSPPAPSAPAAPPSSASTVEVIPDVQPCGPPGRVWVNADYLLWTIKGSPLPVLVTSGPESSSAILDREGTVPLIGGSDANGDARSGGRFTLGAWLNEMQTVGIDAGYLFLGSRAADFAASGTGAAGSPAVGRPFFNLNTGAEYSELVSFPGVVAGDVNVSLRTRFQGAETNGIFNLVCGARGRLDFIAGFRYLQLDEDLSITENLQVLPDVAVLGGSRFALDDQFSTSNRFYGGQVGARAELVRGRLFADVEGKVALGGTQEVVRIGGSTTTTTAGGQTTVQPGALLALATNSGRFDRDAFAVVPEVDVNVGLQLSERWRVSVGYTFLYWSDVVRPGAQIDRGLDTTRIPSNLAVGGPVGPARPAFQFNSGDFWAQGVNFRIEFRF